MTARYICVMVITNRVLLYFMLCVLFISIVAPQKIPGKQIRYIHTKTNSDSLTILSWNIYLLPKWTTWFQSHRNHSWRKRTEEICRFLQSQQADVIVLQEAFNSEAVEIIKEKLQDDYFFISDQFNKDNLFKTNSGLLILSKFPINRMKSIAFENCASDDCLASKGAFCVSFNYQMKSFQLVGTHLQSDYKYPSQYESIRKKQLEQIQTAFTIDDSLSTIFYCGDFNIDYYHTKESSHMIQQLNVTRPSVSDGQYTWQNYSQTAIERFYYDYCLVGMQDNKNEANYKVQIIQATDSLSDVKPSDHYPVSLTYYCKN